MTNEKQIKKALSILIEEKNLAIENWDDSLYEATLLLLASCSNHDCPFKMHSCQDECPNISNCNDGFLDVDCELSQIKVWKNYINLCIEDGI